MLESRKREVSVSKLIDAIVILSFALFFLKILLDGKIHLYVHPRIIPYVFFAACYLVIISGISFREVFKNRQRHDSRKFYHVILMTTLIIAFAIPPATLNANNGGSKLDINLSSQSSTAKASEVVNDSQSIESSDGNNQTDNSAAGLDTTEKLDEEPIQDVIKIDDNNYANTLYDICDRLDDYDGKKIEIFGFVYRDENFEDKQFVIGRYFMSCCTADLGLIGLMCEYDEGDALKNDDWISIKGVIKKGTYEDEPIPVIMVQEVKSIKPPKDEYVYP